MSISEKVLAAEQAATEAKDTLVDLTKAYEAEESDEGLVLSKSSQKPLRRLPRNLRLTVRLSLHWRLRLYQHRL